MENGNHLSIDRRHLRLVDVRRSCLANSRARADEIAGTGNENTDSGKTDMSWRACGLLDRIKYKYYASIIVVADMSDRAGCTAVIAFLPLMN